MPPEAKLAFFHDTPATIRSWEMLLELYGHKVVVKALTVTDAEEVIPTLETQGIQVALVDANLDPRNMDVSGNDGRYLVAKIREQAPSVKAIGVSMGNEIDGADFSWVAYRNTPEDLIKMIEQA